MSTYAIVDTNGLIVGKQSSVPITRPLAEGERLCLRNMSVVGSTTRVTAAEYRYKTATGTLSGAQQYFSYEIVGENLTDIQAVERRFREEIGVDDLTPQPLWCLHMPSCGGFFHRVKFLFWDYPVRGKTTETMDEETLNA